MSSLMCLAKSIEVDLTQGPRFCYLKIYNFLQISENSEPTTFYGPIDVQQRTFIRQVFVDVIIMIENVAMVLLASTTDKEELYNLSVRVIITSYSIAIILKMVFYFW